MPRSSFSTALKSYREFARNTLLALQVAYGASPRMVLGVSITALLSSFVPAISTIIWRDLINGAAAVFGSGSSGELASLAVPFGWLVFITFAEIGLTQLNEYFDQTLQLDLTMHVGISTLEHAAQLDLQFFEDSNFQDHLSRSTANIGQNISQFLSSAIDIIRYFLQTVSLAILLAAIDPIVILIIVPLVIPYIWFNLRLAQLRYTKQVRQTTRKRWSTFYTRRLMDSDYIPEVKIFGLEALLLGRYRTLMTDLKREDYNLVVKGDLLGSTVFDIVFAIVYIGILLYAAYRVYLGTLRIGDLVVYLRSSQQFSSFALRVGKSMSGLAEQSLYVEEWKRFMSSSPIMDASGGDTPPLTGDIVFENVNFQYPSTKRQTLFDINLTVKEGETVAIVGENGAGKSTLVKLLLRLYDTDTGVVKLGGTDLRSINLPYLRQKLSYVPQHFNRFEGTAAENIAFGDWQRLLNDRQAVVAVAKRAGIHQMVSDMPEGYDTMLGRKFGEYELSGGQWQKIAIGRAMARDSLVIVLDEPTASLDARSEFEIFSHLKKLSTGRTAIIISHRFSTIAMADRIVVMEKGRIVEEGTHDVLMDRDGLYANMYRLHQRQMTREQAVPLSDVEETVTDVGE
jgi:ATP-binding cassette, subfamily B, bacterial